MKENTKITELLKQWRKGDATAEGQLVKSLYPHLRAIAANRLRLEPRDRLLQTTDLVQDAFVRLLREEKSSFNDRAHFFAVAARVMRRILVDRARRRNRVKRGAKVDTFAIEDLPEGLKDISPDWLALHLALEELGEIDSRAERVVEFRYFAGMTHDESAEVLGCSRATVERRWRFARAWLAQHLSSLSSVDGMSR